MLTGTGRLVRLALRRDRLTMALWAAGLGGLWALSTTAISSGFDETARRQLVALLVSNPAVLVMRGAPTGVGVGAVMFASVFNYLGLLTAIMATFCAVRHSRADEQTGRAELVGATATGRLAPVAAAFLATVIEVAVVAAAVGVLSVAVGLDPAGSLLMASGLLGIGVAFGAVGLLVAQAAPTARAANGCAAALAGLAFAVRGLGDAAGTVSGDGTRITSGSLSWASPIGWMTHVRPFADPPWQPDPVPLLLYLPLIALLVAAVVAVERRRELGESLLHERAGSPAGARRLGTPLGLAARQQRATLFGWVAAASVLGGFVGAVAPSISESLADDDTIRQILEALGGGAAAAADMVLTFVVALAGIVAVLACAAAMQGVVQLRQEELARGESVLATPTTRLRWAGSWLMIAGAVGVLVLAAFTLAAGTALAISDVPRWDQVLRIGASMLPVVAVYVALGALLLGLAPRSTAVLGWVLLLVPMLAGEFAPLFGPDLAWVANISPFHWLPDPLGDDHDLAPSLVMVAAAAAAIAVGLGALRRRDVTV